METYAKNDRIISLWSSNWSFWVVGFALLSGLILSILSWLKICVEHCSANQDYVFFGIPFAFLGIAFFVAGLTVHLLSKKYLICKKLIGWMISMAIGSEIMFIAIQKYEIGHWCPVCLSIALSLGIAGIVLPADYFKYSLPSSKLNRRGQIMEAIKKGLTSLSFMFVGFLMAFIGVSKFDYAQAAMTEMQDKLAFGNKNSPIEVYFVSDWFCPSCRRVEPLIEKIYPKIQSKVKFYFIDYPIHKKSLNFTPYNLAFMVNDKPQYFRARNALTELAQENESPNDEDIMQLAKQDGLKFEELSFINVKNGMEFFDQIVDKYKLRATPVLIITKPRANKMVKLEGLDEINEQSIMKAIDSMEK